MVKIFDIGRAYKRDEPTVGLELNLEDLQWLQSLVPVRDGFWRELQAGVEAIEGRNALLEDEG